MWIDVRRKTKLESFSSARFSNPFICGSLVQLSERDDLIQLVWQHYDVQPTSPFKEELAPRLLSVGCLQPSALFGNCLSCRELPHLGSHSFLGLSISNDPKVPDNKVVLLPISGQLWRSFQFQGSLQSWPRLLLALHYNSAFPSTHSSFFHSFFTRTGHKSSS